ncbi:unnamed protein product [Calicophoron daubneyi]|uniref:Iron-binding zinc finger CDGSH type domain-containing protein n=1 Tax=Calicophoron daubneyi TaxID=300641 RepID=A0AAV2T6A5_CALDB
MRGSSFSFGTQERFYFAKMLRPGLKMFPHTGGITISRNKLRQFSSTSLLFGKDSDRVVCKYPGVYKFGSMRMKNLEPGKTVRWCACGLTSTQPWCDGTHTLTSFQPLSWVTTSPPEGKDYISICLCRYTKTPPICDGSHKKLKQEIEHRQNNCSCKTPGQQKTSRVIKLADGKRAFCADCGSVSVLN